MNLWEKKKWLVIGGIILACLGFGLWEQQPRELHQGTLPVSQEATETQKRRETAKICVYQAGHPVPGGHCSGRGNDGRR